jgi:hypothetical protein
MVFPQNIHRLLERHSEGVFTERELLARFVRNTPDDRIADLFAILPASLRAVFKGWLDNYPLEGGIVIRDDVPPLPIERIIRMKEYAARFGTEP